MDKEVEDKDIAELQKKLQEKQEEESAEAQDATGNEQIEQRDLTTMSYDKATEIAKVTNLVATSSDKDFVGELSDKNKDVLKASIDLEREKVEAEKQRIKLEQEKIEKEKEENLTARLKTQFGSKLDAQEYHYKSLKPILETFGIKSPMNIYLMWIIAVVACITLIYPAKLLFVAIFGNLIAGATAENRKGFAKGCMWTAVAVLGLALMALLGFGVVKLGMWIFRNGGIL